MPPPRTDPTIVQAFVLGASRFGLRAFLFWSLALLLVKGVFVASLADVFFYGEELAKGSVAKAMLDGVPIDFHRLSYHYYEGGGFFISGLKAVAFWLVGENMLSHRLLGLLTCWLVFCAFWRLLRFHGGYLAAHIGAALFLFGPSGFQRYSLLSLGIHFEAMFFGLLILDEGLRLIRHREWQPKPGRVWLVGLVAGFGVFFSYQNLLVLGWVGLWVIAVRGKWLLSKAGLMLGFGAAVGLLPLIVMASLVGSELLNIHGTELAQVTSNSEDLKSFLKSLFTGASTWTLIARIGFPLAAVMAIALAWGQRRSLRILPPFLTGFLVLWLCAWYFGPFLTEQHYHFFDWLRWAPLTLVVMLLAALGVSGAWAQGGWSRKLAGLSMVIALTIGATETVHIIRKARWNSPAENLQLLSQLKGYNYRGHFRYLMHHLPDWEPGTIRALLAFDEKDPTYLSADIASTLIGTQPKARTKEEWVDFFREVDAAKLPDFMHGMGPAVVLQNRRSLAKSLQSVQSETQEARAQWEEAIGYCGTGLSLFPEDIRREVLALDPKLCTESFLRGVGAQVFRSCVVFPYGKSLVLNPEAGNEFLADFRPEYTEALQAGYAEEQKRFLL